MKADSFIRIMRLATSRPVNITIFLLAMFLWSATFFYVIPKASDGWFGPTVSIAFGIFGAVPGAATMVVVVIRLLRGKPLVAPEPTVCPLVGKLSHRRRTAHTGSPITSRCCGRARVAS